MEAKKNNSKILTIILVVLLLIAVGVICYLLGSNNNTNKNNQNNGNNITEEEKENNSNNTTQEETTTKPVSYSPKCNNKTENLELNIDENKYNNIIEYIKEQKNVEIGLWYCSDFDDINGVNYTLSETEKNKAINELSNSKYYMEDIETGGGACVPTTKISYTRNNKQYFVEYWGHIMSSNDGNIYKIIDKSVTNSFTQEYCKYQISTIGSTINNITKYER